MGGWWWGERCDSNPGRVGGCVINHFFLGRRRFILERNGALEREGFEKREWIEEGRALGKGRHFRNG